MWGGEGVGLKMGKLISGSLRYVSKTTLDLALKFPFLRINVTITVAGT